MKNFIIIALLLAIAAPAFAQEAEWTDTQYGRYQIAGKAMLIETNRPVTIERFTRCGFVEQDRSRSITVNTKQCDKATSEAMQLREQLLALRNEMGIFLLDSATLQYNNQILIARKGDVAWDYLLEKILPLVEATFAEKRGK